MTSYILKSPADIRGWGFGHLFMKGGASVQSAAHPVPVVHHYRALWGSKKGRVVRRRKARYRNANANANPVPPVIRAIRRGGRPLGLRASRRRGRQAPPNMGPVLGATLVPGPRRVNRMRLVRLPNGKKVRLGTLPGGGKFWPAGSTLLPKRR